MMAHFSNIKTEIAAGILTAASFFGGQEANALNTPAFIQSSTEKAKNIEEQKLLTDLKDWSRRYKTEQIVLASPLETEAPAIKEMRRIFLAAARLESPEATKILLELATFNLEGSEKEEGKSPTTLQKCRPHLMRREARHALYFTDSEQGIALLQASVASNRPVDERTAAAEALGHVRNTAKHLEIVATLTKVLGNPKEDVTIRVAATRALGVSSSQESIPQLTTALLDPDKRVRNAAAIVISKVFEKMVDGEIKGQKIEDPALNSIVRPLLKVVETDSQVKLRLEALDVLERYPCQTTITELIKIYDRSTFKAPKGEVGLVARRIHECLKHLTGSEPAGSEKDPHVWSTWWNTVKDKLILPKPAAQAAAQEHDRHYATTAHFYGVELRGSKLVFILDTSGSMKGDKIASMKKELQEAILSPGLLTSTSFDVIFFDTNIDSWKRELVSASPDAKKKAVDFIESKSASGGTNLIGGILTAFGASQVGAPRDKLDQLPDHIIILTDGGPSAGYLIHPVDILEEIRRLNADGIARIDTISPDDANVPFLKLIAEENGGKYIQAKLK